MKKLLLLPLAFLVLSSCNENNEKTENMPVEKKNEVYETIMKRRSIRAYKAEQVPQEKLDSVMKCAIYAPSALNRQPWEVRVVQSAELLAKMNKRFVEQAKGKNLQGSASRAQEAGFNVFHGAPTLIVVARDKNNPYSAVDCGLLAQNVLLSAYSLNLGTCVIGNTASLLNNPSNKDLLQALDLPDTHEVAFGIAIGYPNETPDAPQRDTNKVKYIK
ncbi:MAG: nitroreductase family protein [Dysgonomonas sp.]